MKDKGQNLNSDMVKCGICGKTGKKIPHDGQYFCCKDHIKLFDKKVNEADKKLKLIKKCSICKDPVKNDSWSLTDVSIKSQDDQFNVYKFCSQKCFDKWES